MVNQVQKYVEQYNMIDEGDGIVLGVSGGADSVSLFVVMQELRPRYHMNLVVVHINHGIRGHDADKDEEYVRKLCTEAKVPFVAVHEDVKKLAKKERMSEEEAGRKVRYDAFERVMEEHHCQKIAVAHNKNDLCETVLLNLFRGSGIKGLAGIEPVRGNIIRPLLCVERAEIENYLNGKGIKYQNDASNQEDKYTRNKIRLNILPYVKDAINEGIINHISNTAGMLCEANEYIEIEAEKKFYDVVVKQNDAYRICIKRFKELHITLRKTIIRKILFELSEKQKDIEGCHIQMILYILSKGAGKKADLPYNLECVNEYNDLVIRRKKPVQEAENKVWIEVDEDGIYTLPNSDKTVEFQVIEVTDDNRYELEKMCINPKNDYTKGFDYDKIKNAILLRTREIGDFFHYNAHGNAKKLKEYFVNEKVPAQKRDRILLLADGNHIIWIIGFRISEYYKVSEKTKRILYVKVNGGQRND